MPTQGGSGFSGTQGGLASVLDRVEYMEERELRTIHVLCSSY